MEIEREEGESYPSDASTSWLTKSKYCAAAETTFFRPPPFEWIKDRLANLQQILEHRAARSAQTLRSLLGPIYLEIVTRDIGRPFYRAVTTLDALPHKRTAPLLVRRAVRILCKGGDGGYESREEPRIRRAVP